MPAPPQVNLAVQEALMDAALLGAEGLDFDDFARMLGDATESGSDMQTSGSGSLHGGAGPGSTGPGAGRGRGGLSQRVTSFELFDARWDLLPLGCPALRAR